MRGDYQSLEALAHEARNMGTALGLYCELLAEPGVLSPGFQHYARELKTVAAASRRLMENLSFFESCQAGPAPQPSVQPAAQLAPATPSASRRRKQAGAPSVNARPEDARSADAEPGISGRWALLPALPIRNLAAELRSNRNLLAALAGPSIHLSMEIRAAALPVRLTGEDLTRILVNLVKNSVEAMPSGGRIRVLLAEMDAGPQAGRRLELTVEDAGTGIPPALLHSIFEPGFTTRASAGNGHVEHRGVGLAVTRALVESAGGRIRATNRDSAGATFRIDLPVPDCW
ncbi:MAG TPA: ATP-binding protein [Terracidiphilus sp.]|nr:ATP-binding protein [Terracidiphilus sp.]